MSALPSLVLAVLIGGCSLPRAPIVPRVDAGLLDAGRDAPEMDASDSPVEDAFDGGPDTPPLDVPNDVPVDVPVDVPLDVPLDVPADTPLPADCDGRFAAAPGHIDCASMRPPPPGHCIFFTDPSVPTTCDSICAGTVPGSTCSATYEDGGLACGFTGGGIVGGCAIAFDDMICRCTAAL